MKKILLVCNYANAPKYSSLGFRHFYLAKEWINYGYEVTVLSSSYNHYMYKTPIIKKTFTEEIIDNIKFIWINNIKYNNPHGIFRILNWIYFSISCYRFKSDNYDVVICSSPSIFNIIPFLIKNYFKKNMKIIFEVRDIWPLTLTHIGNYSPSNPLILFLKFIERKSYQKSNAIVGTMGNLKSHIKNIISDKFTLKYIPQGFDINYLLNSKKYNINSIYKLPKKSKLVIGYAGSMSISNNLETIILSARKIKEIDPNIHFYFLGDGLEREKLIKMSKDLNNVFFYKKVEKKYVLSFLNHCDVLYDSIKKSLVYQYGISRNKLIDYMYSSKPILFSYDGYEDVISKINNGFIVKPNNVNELTKKIIEISKIDKKTLNKIGRRGKDYVIKKRQFKHLALDYIKLIESI